MTAAVKGLSGYVLGRMQAGRWLSTKLIASSASVTVSQAGTCLARLVRAGVVEKGAVSIAGGNRLWRRVPEVAAAIGVGDRVRVTDATWRGVEFTVDRIRPPTDGSGGSYLEGRDDKGDDCFFYSGNVVRLPDADHVPWFPPKPPAAWAKDAGLPIRWGPPTPWQQSIGRTS